VIIIPVAPVFPTFDLPINPLPRPAPDPAKVLDKNGPQVPDVHSTSYLTVLGYTRGNWPVVVDYQIFQRCFVYITVFTDGADPYFVRLEGANPGRYQQRITLPVRFSDEPKPAQYIIRAMTDSVGEMKPVPFYIYGVAVGDKAVGSIGIDQLQFRPGILYIQQRMNATYQFHTRFDFKNVMLGFLRVSRRPDGQIVTEQVNKLEFKAIVRDQTPQGNWDGKGSKGGYSKGTHVFRVQAWRKRSEGGDWVVAWSPEFIRVE
jgi:hypothetical protein